MSSSERGDSVGFIGLGHLGGATVSRLVESGRRLVVFDLDPLHVAALTRQGAQAGGSPREVAETLVLVGVWFRSRTQDLTSKLLTTNGR